MNIATMLRYVDLKKGDYWDHRYYIMHDFKLFADKYNVGLCAIMTEHDIEAICDQCSGLIVPGSATNIDPRYYGRAPLDEVEPVDEYALDAKIIKHFVDHNKPIFGICGGHQELNIYFGGTIKKVDDPISHQNDTDMQHLIDVVPDTFVYDVFQKEEVMVNCHHSWEIDDLAPGFKVAARSKDGVIEAIEWKERNIYATQWHPEQSFHTGDPLENKFIENFLKCCEATK